MIICKYYHLSYKELKVILYKNRGVKKILEK